MNIIPIGQKVQVPYEDYLKIVGFKNESSSSHLSRGRSPEEKNRNIVTGKIGEKGFEIMCISRAIPVTKTLLKNSIYGDGGKDFDVYGKTIDVKSIDNPKSFKVITGKKLEAEIYAQCLVEDLTVTFLGMITTEEIKQRNLLREDKNPKTGEPYWYVHKNYLINMAEIFKDK